MLKENQFQIDGNKHSKIKMSFNVMTWEDSFEHDIEVGCGEDIEEVMKSYFEKDWGNLFEDSNGRSNSWIKEITDVSFEGIYIVAQEVGKGHVYTMIMNRSIRSTVTMDIDKLGDKNAEKIKQIRDILNS